MKRLIIISIALLFSFTSFAQKGIEKSTIDTLESGYIIIPHQDNIFKQRCPAAVVVAGGNGSFVGLQEIERNGYIESPIFVCSFNKIAEGIKADLNYVLSIFANKEVEDVNAVVIGLHSKDLSPTISSSLIHSGTDEYELKTYSFANGEALILIVDAPYDSLKLKQLAQQYVNARSQFVMAVSIYKDNLNSLGGKYYYPTVAK